MKAHIKASDKQKVMNSRKMRMSDQEIEDYVDELKTMKDVKNALAAMMKQIVAIRHNIKRNRN